MPYSLNAVVPSSFSFPDYTFTMNVSGAVTRAHVGRAVALDTTADNTVKLAGDGDEIYGRLESFETGGLDGLTVGAVSRKFRAPLPVKAGLTGFNAVARGDTLVGAGDGEVKALNSGSAKTPNRSLNVALTAPAANAVVVEML